MAGLGGTCSHVAAMLWAIESGIRQRDSMTVNYWVIPNGVKEVPYALVKEIYFLGKGQVVNLRVTPTPSRSCSPSSMLSSSKSCPTPAFVFPPTTGQSSSTSAHSSPSPSTPHLLELLSDEEMKGLLFNLKKDYIELLTNNV